MSALPESFGKYFLTEKIASGGMAEIYLAKLIGPDGFEKCLVIKKIHPELTGQRQFVEMFVAEAKTLVSLSHANIVPIYELGMVDSSYFIAMEYIDGPTLAQLQATLQASGERISLSMAAYVCAELLRGLDYAHRKGEGVIHRDLSPRNVMLSRDGEVKLVDFGISIAGSGRDASESMTDLPSGSYPYMSPEQVANKNLDPRSDIFAMGILLWELITGQKLFARDSDEETLHAVLHADIQLPSVFAPEARGVLDEICTKALQRKREDRFATANDFLVAINRYLYSQDEGVGPQHVSDFLAKYSPKTAISTRRRQQTQGGGTVPFKRSGTVPFERPRAKRETAVQSFATRVGLPDSPLQTRPPAPAPTLNPQQEPLRPPRSRRWIYLAIPVTGFALVYFFFRDSDTTGRNYSYENTLDAGALPIADARPSPAVDGATIVDAAPAPIVDAKVPKRIRDNRPAPPKPQAEVGTLRIGASPWADVYYKGKKIGRAPGTFTLPAGTQTLQLRFKKQSLQRTVTIKPGESSSLGVVQFDRPSE